MKLQKLLLVVPVCFALSSCVAVMSAQEHRKDVADDSGDNISVGKVQREIKVGMSGADVVAILGSPNIVTSDEQRRETWVYDKISTERVISSSADGGNTLIFGGGGFRGAGAAATTQKTLTIIIKFNKSGKVRDFAYNTSKF